ncbi:MAG: hypothetical protein KIT31_00745 [Deltaproteobacteria bacterium]|nr:hypothetical protein [Deltaproteobacteria bacterium]
MNARLPQSWNAVVHELREVFRDPRLLAWALFIILFPFYVVPSGLPQPAAWLLIAVAPSMFGGWDGRFSRDSAAVLRALLRFVLYVIAANVVWSFVLLKLTINLKEGFLLSPLFYVYNAGLLLAMLVLYRRYGTRLLWVTTRALFVSVGIQVAMSFVMPTRLRNAVGFNEANQLGYYALVSACVWLLAQRRTRLSNVHVTIGVLMCSYLALLSASKAAVACIGLLAVAVLVGRLRTMLLLGVVMLVLVFTPNPFSAAIERAQRRFETDQHLGFFEERGYDRIVNHPEYWAVGSGEGAYSRFADTTLIGSHELHSSLGTLFFCYGIVGLSLFVWFMWTVMKRTRFHTWLVMGPAFAYGMTHQGLRFSLFWVLIGVVMILREDDRLASNARPVSPPTPSTPAGPPAPVRGA